MALKPGDIHDISVRTTVRLGSEGRPTHRYYVTFSVRKAGPFELIIEEADYDAAKVKAAIQQKALEIDSIESYGG